MAKANEVATQLRMLADCLDKAGDTQMGHLFLSFTADNKDTFKALAHVWPRPYTKKVDYADTDYPELRLVHDGWMRINVSQKSVCTLVEPAKKAVYKCEPFLSEDEEAALEAAQ